MLIYQIPADVEKNANSLSDFQQLILSINLPIDICLFIINFPTDVSQITDHILSMRFCYLVMDDHYEVLFSSLLKKYEALKLSTLPKYENVSIIVGDAKAIPKVTL